MTRFNPNQHNGHHVTDLPCQPPASFAHLRRKLRWQLLFAYVTPIVVLSAFFHFQYTASLRQGIDNHLKSIAENQRSTIDLYLRERVNNLRAAFRHAPLVPSPNQLDLEPLLDKLREEGPAFVDLGLFAPDGTLVAYAGPYQDLVGKHYHQESWWTQLFARNEDYYISDVYLGFRREPHFIIAVRRPIDDQLWVMRASVDPKKFTAFVRSSYLAGDAEAFVLNLAGERQTVTMAAAESRPPTWIPEVSPTTRVNEVVDGRAYLAATSWLTETRWALVAWIPKDEAYAPVWRARWILIAISVAALALIVGIVFRYTGRSVAELEAADEARSELRSQLFHAAKLASVGEMAAGVAHEINNPLAVIYEEAAMMEDILDPQFAQELDLDDFRERLAAIIAATLRGRAITGKLLAFSRQHEPRPEPTEVNRLVDRVIEVKAHELTLSDIELVKQFADDLPEVSVNRNHMDQILLNLLNNAKDAITGPGRITVRTRRDDRWLCIEVADTGCGMTAEVMRNIFFPFFTTKPVGKGTGLGMSISYGLIQAAGGEIEVDSEVGRGTTVTVRLPIDTERDRQPLEKSGDQHGRAAATAH